MVRPMLEPLPFGTQSQGHHHSPQTSIQSWSVNIISNQWSRQWTQHPKTRGKRLSRQSVHDSGAFSTPTLELNLARWTLRGCSERKNLYHGNWIGANPPDYGHIHNRKYTYNRKSLLAYKDGFVVEDRKPRQEHLKVYGCKALFAITTETKPSSTLQSITREIEDLMLKAYRKKFKWTKFSSCHSWFNSTSLIQKDSVENASTDDSWEQGF